MNARCRLLTANTAVAGATALGILALSACGSDGVAAKNGDKLDVVTSFYPMEFLAKEIGREHISVSSLTKPGVEPHDLELTPRQTGRLGEAGLIVYLKGLQPAIDEAISQSGAEHIAEATSYTRLEEHGSEVQDAEDHGDEDQHAGEDGEHGAGHPGEEDDGHGHEEGAEDPHIWLDPVRYAEVAEGVGQAMEKADPDNAADYRKNTDTLTGKLTDLDKEFEDGLANTGTRTFITTHAAFGYLAERYGLDEEAIAGLDPESGPSGARMKKLHTIAEEEKVSTVFFETLASDTAARTLAEDLGLKTDVLDPVEGITDKSRGADYLEVMRANLRALEKALGAAQAG
jgi:zinc transport system substrate-binding protein